MSSTHLHAHTDSAHSNPSEAKEKTANFDSIQQIIRKIPKELLNPDTEKSMGYFYRDLLLICTTIAAILFAESWWVGLPLSLILGTLFLSLFIIAHDCGHRSFSKSKKVCDTVGHISASFMLWPYHVWRLSHDNHHRSTHHAKKEIAWRPFTLKNYAKATPFQRAFYRATRTWALPFSSYVFTGYFFKEALKGRRSRYWKKEELGQVRFSVVVCILATIAHVAGSIMAGGLYGFICLFIIPQTVFQMWLSIYTYFHHTTPERTYLPEGEWSMGKGQLEGSIHVKYPKVIEWFHHDLNWHVPHHVCVSIPHYNLRKAHSYLKKAYPASVLETTLSFSMVREAQKTCQLISGRDVGEVDWISFKEAEKRIEEGRFAQA